MLRVTILILLILIVKYDVVLYRALIELSTSFSFCVVSSTSQKEIMITLYY